jgi:hypothetical protein
LLDAFQIPDLEDISIDVSAYEPLGVNRPFEELGAEDDGDLSNIVIEAPYGDGAFSYQFTSGYKAGYEENFALTINFHNPAYLPDGYGPIFYATTGQVIKFSTPQQSQDNIGVNPLEIIAAEKVKNYAEGYNSGKKAGILDAETVLRSRNQV